MMATLTTTLHRNKHKIRIYRKTEFVFKETTKDMDPPNGLFEHLLQQKSNRNPHETGLVKVSASSYFNGNAQNVLDWGTTSCWWRIARNQENGSILIFSEFPSSWTGSQFTHLGAVLQRIGNFMVRMATTIGPASTTLKMT
jgi:hypothetical protein